MDALTHIKADIFGFVEIEGGPTALRKLATSLTAATGFEYTFSEDDAYSNGSFTKAGYVYRKDRVKQVGKVASNNTATSNRKKVTMFEEIATGERFLLSVNHFKAKSGIGNGADADQKDGQGIFNATRTNEANSVLSSDMDKLYQDPDILVVGDLNAYAKEDPIQAFINAGYTDLHRAFHKDTSYSYVFRDQAGYLDHALASKTLYPQVTGMAAYHINSDEHDGFTYDKSSDLTMFRSSDHDPVLVGLRLSNEPLYKWQPIVKQDNSLVLSADNNPLSARVFTLTGFLYSQVELSAGQELNLNDLHLPKGVYIVELYGGQHQHKAQKVIVTQ
jgi:predicted extracellular nuclease